MNAITYIQKYGVKKARGVVNGVPTFIREALDQNETMYNARTSSYIERGVQSALVQLEGDDYYRTTMPYTSAFYDECVLLSDLKRLVESVDLISSVQVLGRTGYDEVKSHIENCDPNWCHFHYKKWKQAIADYEAIYSEQVK